MNSGMKFHPQNIKWINVSPSCYPYQVGTYLTHRYLSGLISLLLKFGDRVLTYEDRCSSLPGSLQVCSVTVHCIVPCRTCWTLDRQGAFPAFPGSHTEYLGYSLLSTVLCFPAPLLASSASSSASSSSASPSFSSVS